MNLYHLCIYFHKITLESLCLLTYPPFHHHCFIVTMTTAHSIAQKQNLTLLQPRQSSCNVSSKSNPKQTYDASLDLTTLFTNFSRQPQANTTASFRLCSPKVVKVG